MGQAYLGTTELNKLYLGTTQINSTKVYDDAPYINDMVFWFQDASNNITGSTWVNAVNKNAAGLLAGGASLSGSIALLDNSSSDINQRDQRFLIRSVTGSANIQSALILFNQPRITGVGGNTAAYFYDEYNSGGGNGYFNAFFSVDTDAGEIHGPDATFYGYVDGEQPVNGGVITQTLLTNGTGTVYGGSGSLQWRGPNEGGINNTKRIFFFNYNPNVPITLDNVIPWSIGTNGGGTEGSSLGLFEMIGYNRSLSFVEFNNLVNYLVSTGVID